jgi:hypothetical protein
MDERFRVPGFYVPGVFPLFKGEKFFAEGIRKKAGVAGLTLKTGFHDAMGLPGADDALHRRGVQQRLVAGKEQIVSAVFPTPRRSFSRFYPKAYAFPLPLFRRGIADRCYRQISGKGGNTIIGGNKKNSAEAAGERANQIQGVPRQGLTPERNEKFVVIAETPGKTGGHQDGKNIRHWFIVI